MSQQLSIDPERGREPLGALPAGSHPSAPACYMATVVATCHNPHICGFGESRQCWWRSRAKLARADVDEHLKRLGQFKQLMSHCAAVWAFGALAATSVSREVDRLHTAMACSPRLQRVPAWHS